MHLEAFTCHKDPGAPLANDDRVVVHAGRLFAVIDGVTDKSGRALPGGRSRGQAAGELIERALRDLVDAGDHMTAEVGHVMDLIQRTFLDEYRSLGMEADVARDPHLRFGAQLAAAFFDQRAWRVLVVGDCGVRVNGVRTVHTGNRGDAVLALWRARVFAAAGPDADAALDVARRYTVTGSGRFLEECASRLPPAEYRRCASRSEAEALAAFPDLPPALVRDTLERGLIGLATHRNATGPLGSPCIDGTAVPVEQVRDETLAAAEVTTLELFSDGYFGTPAPGATAVADWEAHLAHVEAVDPYKVGAYPSTKGSSSGRFTDDRSVLVLTPTWPPGSRAARPADPTKGASR